MSDQTAFASLFFLKTAFADIAVGQNNKKETPKPRGIKDRALQAAFVLLTIMTWGLAVFVYFLSGLIPFVLTMQAANEKYYNPFVFNTEPVVFNVLFNFYGAGGIVFLMVKGQLVPEIAQHLRLINHQSQEHRKSFVLWPLFYCLAFCLDLIFWVCGMPVGSLACSCVTLIIAIFAYFLITDTPSTFSGSIRPSPLQWYDSVDIHIKILYVCASFNLLENLFAIAIEFAIIGFVARFQLLASIFLGGVLVSFNLVVGLYKRDEQLLGLIGFFCFLLGIESHSRYPTFPINENYFWICAIASGALMMILGSVVLYFKESEGTLAINKRSLE